MVRKLVLALAILAAVAVPVQASEADFRDWHDRDRHERFEQSRPVPRAYRPYGYAFNPYGYAYNPYGYVRTPRCYWQAAYWANQIYPNEYGGYAYVPQFVPGQWICS
jgi:hypothetical protein